jgi:hypothetical protein
MADEQIAVPAATPIPAAETPAPEVTADAEQQQARPEPVEADPGAEAKKALRGVQKRINELTREKREALEQGQREAEYWRQQALTKAQEAEQLRQAQPRKRLEDFQGIEDYTESVARNQAEQLLTEQRERDRIAAFNQHQAWAQEQQAQAQAKAVNDAITAKAEAAVKKYPDFLDSVTNPELPPMRDTAAFNAMLESDVGADVLYYLSKNPAKAFQIVALSPLSQVREIGRLEAAILNGRTVTGAPPPPDAVGTGKGGANKDPQRMSYDEFVAFRRKQIAARR